MLQLNLARSLLLWQAAKTSIRIAPHVDACARMLAFSSISSWGFENTLAVLPRPGFLPFIPAGNRRRGDAMNRAGPMPSDLGLEATRPATYLARAATANLRAFITRSTAARVAEQMWPRDTVTAQILRAASNPAMTTTSGWAQELAGISILDTLQSITSVSAAAELISRGLQIDMTGISEYRVPGRVLNAGVAGQWVSESGAIAARQLSISNAAILRPRKLAVLMAYTREQIESSNIEAVVRQTLGEAAGLALDVKMFSADAASASAPAGLFAGTAPLGATAGGGSNALTTDLNKLFAALAANNGGKTAVIVAALPQALMLKATVGPKFDTPIITSTSLAAGTVAVVEVASVVSGFGSVVEFNTTNVAAVHMEDTSPQDITGGSPSPAAPVKSMFQIDAILLRTTLWAAWGLRAAGHAQWIQGATW